MYFRLGELFCGPGGIAKGALSAEIDNPKWRIIHAWANDYDQSTCDTYTRNICPNDPNSVICQDVHTLNIEKLGAIDALAFGAPCNDFSLVGEKKGFEGKYGPLYSYGVRALEVYNEGWHVIVVWECTLAKLNREETLKNLKEEIEGNLKFH